MKSESELNAIGPQLSVRGAHFSAAANTQVTMQRSPKNFILLESTGVLALVLDCISSRLCSIERLFLNGDFKIKR